MANNENDAHEHKRGLFGRRKRSRQQTTVEVPEPGPSAVDVDHVAATNAEPHPPTAPIGEPDGFIASADPVAPQTIDVPSATGSTRTADEASREGREPSAATGVEHPTSPGPGAQVSGSATQSGDRFVPPELPKRPVYDSGQAAADAARILRAARARRPAGAPDPVADSSDHAAKADLEQAEQPTTGSAGASDGTADKAPDKVVGEASRAEDPQQNVRLSAVEQAPSEDDPTSEDEQATVHEQAATAAEAAKPTAQASAASGPSTVPNPLASEEAAASALIAQQGDSIDAGPARDAGMPDALAGAPRSRTTRDAAVDEDTHPSAQPLVATPITLGGLPDTDASAENETETAEVETAEVEIPASENDASGTADADTTKTERAGFDTVTADQPQPEAFPRSPLAAADARAPQPDAGDELAPQPLSPEPLDSEPLPPEPPAPEPPAPEPPTDAPAAPLITERNVEVRHLQRSFGRKNKALVDVSFTARSGQVTALVGANGAGKSTVLQILATLLKAQSGDVRINGIDAVARPQDARSSIGWVPDHIPLWPRMTVRRTLQTFARLYGIPRSESRRRVIDLMVRTGLDDVAKRQARQLSRGQRQLLSLARALVHDPQVLLLDEPTSGLDVISRDRVHTALRQLADEGKTVLIATNWFEGLDDYADHVVYLSDGVTASAAEVNAAASTPRSWRIRSLDPTALLEALQRFETPFDLDPITQGVEVLMGSDEAANLLLARLVIAGVPVHDYGPVGSSTEQTFRALQLRTPTDTTESVLDALGAQHAPTGADGTDEGGDR